MTRSITGIIPVMLTPFSPDNQIDWSGYERLIEWYINNGAEALFAVCMSSEMHYLALEERVELARFTVKTVKKRVPVVASGHVSKKLAEQRTELAAIAEVNVDFEPVADVSRPGTGIETRTATPVDTTLAGCLVVGLGHATPDIVRENTRVCRNFS